MTDQEFSEFYKANFMRVLRYCQFRTACLADAEDMASEAFARLLAQPPMPEARLIPWLYRVVTNLNTDRHRRTRRESPLEDAVHLPSAAQHWTDPMLWSAVKRLKPRQQAVVYLRFVEDWTFPEIGAFLGRSEGAAKMILKRGLDRLGMAMEVREDA